MKRQVVAIAVIIAVLFTFKPGLFAASPSAIQSANTLYTLGLFKGTGVNADGTPIYDLDRAPTRHEAITMLVRLLGKENEAVSKKWDIPFTDVAEWAVPYVGYAYANGLTLGTDADTFGGNDIITATQYITFVLRALGYSSDTDFVWNKAWELSDKLGFTNGQYNSSSAFTRGDVAFISYNALSQNNKGTDKKLLAALFESGAVTMESIAQVGLSGLLSSPEPVPLTAKEVSEKASPAVFYIEVYASSEELEKGLPRSAGSGFFISDDGIAVTNYHVLDRTTYAIITTIDGASYTVNDCLYYDADRDIAVIRVSKQDLNGEVIDEFPYLPVKNSDSVSNGDVVYAIGSPLGLQNTISNGIVSNRYRILSENGLPYIQITAPISPGSSGGVLLNEYGEAIGVTTGFFITGQNLNLAVPLDLIIAIDTGAKGIPYAEAFAQQQINADAGKIVDYTDAPGFVDFGAYFGVPALFHTTLDTGAVCYDYSITDILSISSIELCIIDYYQLLYYRGCVYLNSFTNTEGSNVLRFVNPDLYKSLYISEVIQDGVQCMRIAILDDTVAKPSEITGYSEAADIPDFGAFIGIEPITNVVIEDTLYYEYLTYEIEAVDVESQAIINYGYLLYEWGFFLKETSGFVNDYGNTVLVFTNTTDTRTVYISVIERDGLDLLNIIIYPADDSVASSISSF
jgi:hypothetical protein